MSKNSTSVRASGSQPITVPTEPPPRSEAARRSQPAAPRGSLKEKLDEVRRERGEAMRRGDQVTYRVLLHYGAELAGLIRDAETNPPGPPAGNGQGEKSPTK